MECFRKNQEALLTEVWNVPAKMKILPILSRNYRKKKQKKKLYLSRIALFLVKTRVNLKCFVTD